MNNIGEIQIVLKPIGYVISSRKEKEDDYWGNVESTIMLDENRFSEESIRGLEEFSHLEIIFYFNKVDNEKIVFDSRHPSNDMHLPKVGIFAQRAKSRPNRLGLSTCKIVKVDGL